MLNKHNATDKGNKANTVAFFQKRNDEKSIFYTFSVDCIHTHGMRERESLLGLSGKLHFRLHHTPLQPGKEPGTVHLHTKGSQPGTIQADRCTRQRDKSEHSADTVAAESLLLWAWRTGHRHSHGNGRQSVGV